MPETLGRFSGRVRKKLMSERFLVPRVRIELTTLASSEANLDYIIIPINRELGACIGLLLGLTY